MACKILSHCLACLFCFSIQQVSAATSVVPEIESVSPHRIFVGKQQEITLKVSGWQPGSQITLSPGGPELIHTLALEGVVNDIVVSGHYLYAASDKHGLLILDISDPHEPILVGHWDIGKKPTKLKLSGKRAYLVDDHFIYSIDIRRPEDPALIAKFLVNEAVTDLVASATRIYVLLDQKRLLVLDHSTDVLKKMVTLEFTGAAQAITVNGSYLYLANGDNGLKVFTLGETNSIKQVGEYRTTGPALDVNVTGGLAYVATGSNGLTILDVSEPVHIRWIGSHQQLGTIDKVMTDNGRLFVANDESKLMLIDTTNPAMPAIHSMYGVAGPLRGFQVQGQTVYAATGDRLLAIDFAATPPVLSNEGLDFGQGVNFGGERRLYIRDNIAYVADWFSGIHLYDISKPVRPKLLSSFHTQGSPKGIVVRGNYAYVADDDHGVHIIDIRDTRDPVLVSTLLTPGLAYTPVLDGDKLYLASHRGGFQIIDIRDANNPQLISSTDTPGKSWSIQVADNIAYIADDELF